jgi:nucleoside phosphorylase
MDHIADLILNYDPENPQQRFKADAPDLAALSASDRLPVPPPWPDGKGPQAVPLHPAPSDTASLAGIAGWDHVDAVVVTWTAAEAAALAAMFTPGYLPSQWYEYRHGVEEYVPLVTGGDAPFNSTEADMSRFYHSLGLYFPCRINGKNVLLMKSGLHLDYDGPQVPVRKLITELAQTLKPSLFITTGTGGGINGTVNGAVSVTELGDVVVGTAAAFDCQQQFKNASWLPAGPTPASPLSAQAAALMTPALLSVNAAKVSGGRSLPKIWTDANIVTTDFFAFSDSLNTYGLEGKGRACDMGDAMVGLALETARASLPGMLWHAIRNASDPQITVTAGDIAAAEKLAGNIYLKYGPFTTAASAIATWAIIASM